MFGPRNLEFCINGPRGLKFWEIVTLALLLFTYGINNPYDKNLESYILQPSTFQLLHFWSLLLFAK